MKQRVEIFRSLFKGREDVFAIRWERDYKSGYMPAYDLNWDEFRIHKAKGGSLKNFENKQYALLTDTKLINHFSGKEIIGIYPLLKNNTSWFIVADFDQSGAKNKRWEDDCRIFISQCEKYNLPVYLERSRSGNGGHVWMFFEDPYPAFKSRRLFTHFLNASGIVPGSDTNSNFDRLFPSQDEHSATMLGNLISLPLQKTALENGNACFIDPENLKPFADQWAFLHTVRKIKIKEFDELYNTIHSPVTVHMQGGNLQITLSNQIILPRFGLNPLLIKYLKDTLNFINADYLIRKRSGKNTHSTEAYFKTVEEKEDTLVLPRGFIGRLLRFCNEQKIIYQLEDKRIKLEPVRFSSSISLLDYQQKTLDITDKKDFGVIVAPPGSGKTVMGLEIIAKKGQPALIIVHRRQLFNQWVDRIQSFLGIPKFRIGRIENGRYEIGNEITVAMIQSLPTDLGDNDTSYQSFGTIIVDECHHIPAKTFREVILHFHSFYLYGFTATPTRKNRDEKLIFFHIGDIIHEVVIPASARQHKQLSVTIQTTELFAPFNAATDKTETLINILIHDTARNEIMVADIKRESMAGRKILVLTERKSHVDILQQYLKGICETITLTGDDSDQNKKAKLQLIEQGDFQVLIATGQLLGEGTDIGILNCLVLAYPFAFEGKLIQYIGRVQRSPVPPVIYDYRDHKIDYFNNLFRQRNKYYRKLMKSGQLTLLDELVLVFNGVDFYINTTDKLLSIDCLDLPLPVERFKDDVIWKLRVNRYDDEQGELFTEIIDYNFLIGEVTDNSQASFYFYGIEKIKFRNMDTGGFLRSVILKRQSPANNATQLANIKKELPKEQVILKTMKVPFWKINFLYGRVSFPMFIEALNQEIVFEINNTDIRPEFAAIRDYFSKALKKKMIAVTITVRYTENKILSATAQSEDIDSINYHMIDSVRFEFIKREILSGKGRTMGDSTLQTMGDLLSPHKEAGKIFTSEMNLLEDILKIKKSKHYLQLKYLSTRHEASVLKVRFVLQPFSFLFLIAGEKKFYIVWETLDSEEATYVWHMNKNREALRIALDEIEITLSNIRQAGRQNFLEKENNNFSRVLHDYSDAKKGFVIWKGLLEERLA
ncbi:MAG: DEAD/DEAH box helicase family protein [Bacteroidota bacterium]